MENFMEFLPGYQLLVSLHFIAISLSVKTWWKHETRNKLEVPNTTKMFKIPKIISSKVTAQLMLNSQLPDLKANLTIKENRIFVNFKCNEQESSQSMSEIF